MVTEEVFKIQGNAGERTLSGTIPVSGAKNAVLKAFAAATLFQDVVTLRNVPHIEDVQRMAELLEDMGAEVSHEGDVYRVCVGEDTRPVLSRRISSMFRGSVVLTGPVLARFGRVEFPYPGGCVIGKRPIDIFLEGFEAMGAKVSQEGDVFVVHAESGKLVGAELFLDKPSVTATETFMMAGVLAEGRTVIKNAAMEPEIEHLAEFLRTCGAKISGAGTATLEIDGGGLLSAGNNEYVTMPDRIEAGSFIILGACAAREITVTNCEPKHLDALLYSLRKAGVSLEVGEDFVTVRAENEPLRSVDIKTHEYPGFPTDLQQPMTVFLTQAEGESLVFETIWESRLNYTEQLTIMGADIMLMDAHRALVKGATSLKGRNLESPDLRAGLAFVIAAIVAKGESTIHNVYNIDRGYANIEERLRAVGVDIERRKI